MEKTSQALSLENIIQFELPALLRRQHLNRDMIIIFVGDRGDGKSMGAAIISILDYMLQGEPCFSHNMDISVQFNVDDATAGKYGLKGGPAAFQSRPLNLSKFLYSDNDEYNDGVIVIDEINIALADARRSMSNQNLAADDVGQQLRKFRSALIGTCIHEMFIDNRIRDMVDVFVRTKDTALTPEGLANRKRQGIEFEWSIYPMTRKLTGETYETTGKTLTATINGQAWWGAINSMQKQKRQKISGVSEESGISLEIKEAPQLTAAKSKWGWLYEAIKKLHDEGYEEIHSEELWKFLNLDERGLRPNVVGPQLRLMGIKRRNASSNIGGQYYIIDQFDLAKKKNLPTLRKEAVLA